MKNVHFIPFLRPVGIVAAVYVKRTSPLNNSYAILLVSNVKAGFYDIILMAGLFRLMKNSSCHLTSCCDFCGVFLFFLISIFNREDKETKFLTFFTFLNLSSISPFHKRKKKQLVWSHSKFDAFIPIDVVLEIEIDTKISAIFMRLMI